MVTLLATANSPAQLWGQWPMGGHDDAHSGKKTLAGTFTDPGFTPGALKWSVDIEDLPPVTGVAIGDYDSETHEYRVYYGAYPVNGHGEVVCLQVEYDEQSNAFSVAEDPVWRYTLDGVPSGTPTLAWAGGFKAVYVSDSARRVHCVRASDGEHIWRSEELFGSSLTPPLYAPCTDGECGDRDYVCDQGANPATLYAFETIYYASPPNIPSEVEPEWDLSIPADGTLRQWAANVPSVGYSLPEGEEEETAPFLYLGTHHVTLHQVRNLGTYGDVQWSQTTGFGAYVETTGWPIVVNDGDRGRVYFGGYLTTDDTGRIWGFDSDGEYLSWDANPVFEANDQSVPPDAVSMGALPASPCTDSGTPPTVFFPTVDEGSGTGKPAMIRLVDLTPGQSDGMAYVTVNMSSGSDDLLPTPVYVVTETAATYLYFVTSTGKFYVTSPTGSIPTGFPENLGLEVPWRDLAVDEDGAVIIPFQSEMRAYWGRWRTKHRRGRDASSRRNVEVEHEVCTCSANLHIRDLGTRTDPMAV